VLMIVTDVVLVLPSILFMMLIATYFKYQRPMLVSLIIGLPHGLGIHISRIAGLSDLRIIFENLIPNMASYIFMASVLLLMSGIMIAEAGLSMIGLGVTRGILLGIILY